MLSLLLGFRIISYLLFNFNFISIKTIFDIVFRFTIGARFYITIKVKMVVDFTIQFLLSEDMINK